METKSNRIVKSAGLMILYLGGYLAISEFTGWLYFTVMGKIMFLGNQLMMNVPLYHLFLDLFLLPYFLIIFALINKQNLFKAVNFNWGQLDWKTVGILAVLCIFTSMFTAAFMKMPWAATAFPNVSMLLNSRLLVQPLYQFIFWWPLHCAIWREMLFRGIIYNEFKKSTTLVIAIIMQGLMQGFLFFEFIRMDLVFYGFLSCVIFALIYEWCNSLWASIVSQLLLEGFLFGWNKLNYVLFTEKLAPIFLGLSFVLILFSLLYLYEYRTSVYKNQKTEAGVAAKSSAGATVS